MKGFIENAAITIAGIAILSTLAYCGRSEFIQDLKPPVDRESAINDEEMTLYITMIDYCVSGVIYQQMRDGNGSANDLLKECNKNEAQMLLRMKNHPEWGFSHLSDIEIQERIRGSIIAIASKKLDDFRNSKAPNSR